MQKNIAKGLAVGSLMLAVGLTSFGSVASAKSINATTKAKTTHTTKTLKGHKRTLPGKVVSASTTTLVMTSGNKTYTIDVTGVTPVDRKGTKIALTDIKAGNKVSVKGTVTGTTVTIITKLRDITLPVNKTKTK